jgi:hypothetical protein
MIMHLTQIFWEINLAKRVMHLAGLLSILILLAGPSHGLAQAETIPTQAAPKGDGKVSGTIVNRSPGGTISGAMDIMLHAWDANRAEKVMLHGKSNPDGSFAFTDISLQTGLAYAVMADYQGATYYSDPIPVQAEKELQDIQVSVYDLTQDLSALRIDEMHILLDWAQGDLGVTEVYIFSNTGEYTVKMVFSGGCEPSRSSCPYLKMPGISNLLEMLIASSSTRVDLQTPLPCSRGNQPARSSSPTCFPTKMASPMPIPHPLISPHSISFTPRMPV